MKSDRMITLFRPPLATPHRGSASLVASLLAHIAGCVWLILGLSHTPKIKSRPPIQRFAVRVLNAPAAEPPQLYANDSGRSTQSGRRTAVRTLTPADASPAPSAAPSAAAQLAKLVRQEQMLVQPDAPPDLLLQHKVPIPTVFTWTPVVTAVKPVISAPLQKSSIVAKLRPAAEPPNRELDLANIRMSSTPFKTQLPTLATGTTTPIVVRGPDPAKQVPETASKPLPEPAPARVLSQSELQTQQGPVVIPLANATPRPSSGDSLAAGRSASPADGIGSAAKHPVITAGQGVGSIVDKGHGSGSSPSDNKPDSQSVGEAPVALVNTGPGGSATFSNKATGGAPNGQTGIAANSVPDSGAGIQASQYPVSHITRPKDGQFGVVVVGSALAEEYPEASSIWSGRLVYTVYLHMGTGKSWILQYALSPSVEASGGGSRPEAPWPYDIVQPRFDPEDFNSDALMVHGFVNAAGRFERLALVFPSEFAKVKFLLNALEQWQFRPARQNGQVAAVEILLIIPEQPE